MKRIQGLSLLVIGLTIVGFCLHLTVVLASKALSVFIILVGAFCIGLGFFILGIKSPAQEHLEMLMEDNCQDEMPRIGQKQTEKVLR